jgi:glutamate synthase (NADPH/NADH) small chain
MQEVSLGFDALAAQLESLRCLECKNRPCVEGCPVHVDIPGFIALLREGDFEGAIAKIREANCLPAITGRVCPQETQCQLHCTVGKSKKNVNEAVSIGRLERFLADWKRERGGLEATEIQLKTGRRVAIVGSGPAGLSAAGDLIKMGHSVTVFEAFHKLGGVLAYGIPEFRLPKKIVQAEIDYLKRLGVAFEVNTVIGQTITVDELLGEEGFRALFIATGAGLPHFMSIPGEELVGVYSANEYLTRVNLMEAHRFPYFDTPPIRSRNVAVLGGGNVAMDCARTALRLGAENVYLVYRRSEAELPARAEEVHHAREEGVQFMVRTNAIKILSGVDGCVRAIQAIKMELGAQDASGRRRPTPVPGSEYEIDVDTVIEAIGNSPNPLIAATTPELQASKNGTIIVDEETCKTCKRGVFAGGDIVSGAATVIQAMGQGRRAAKWINDYLVTGEW